MYLQEYYNKCKKGEIIIGRELMKQLSTLMHYIDDNIYKFDEEKALKRIRFIETQCKHSISPFAGKPFLLELWEKALIEAIYGFYFYDEEIDKEVRLFKECLLLIGRKNGKSTICSALANCEFFCGNIGTNILCASNDYSQADICYQEINNMRESSHTLERCTHKNQKGIFFGNPAHKKRRGKFSYQNKAKITKISAKTGAKEGKNIDFAIIDEIHEQKDDSLVMPIKQSMSTKDESMLFEITTEGFIEDGYLDNRLIYARKVLEGELYSPRLLIWLYTQDSENEVFQNRDSWYKSNPNLGITKKFSYLDGLIEEAKTSTSARAYMLAKDFNIKQNNASAWLPEDVIINNSTYDLEKFRGCYYVGGIDYSETSDLCNAKALFIDPETLQKYTVSMYFIPEVKANEDELNPEKYDYKGLAQKGLVTICEGDENNAKDVADWFYSLYEEYDMTPFKIGYDNWHMKELKNYLKEYFGEEVLERIGMNAGELSNPMSLVESDLRYKKLNYNNNELDRKCLKNTAIKLDSLGRAMPVKVELKSKNRIDGALGFIIAYATLSRYRSDYMKLIA